MADEHVADALSQITSLPGFQLDAVNLFNFGGLLQSTANNVSTILANQNTLTSTIENQQQQLSAQLNAKIQVLTNAMGEIAVLLQAVILGIGQLATLSNQQTALTQLQQIYDLLAPFKATTVGLDPTDASTVPQLPPGKPGP